MTAQNGKGSPPPADPYSEADRLSRLESSRAEYERLAKKHAFEERVKHGVGVDWNVIQHIEK